jgi:EAL domain-containing protein (putative c-di-GMP-specific phosphodiesterase class I)
LNISTSIGISLYPLDGDNVETLLKNADRAMYHSKAEGKNNYQFYKEPMNVAVLEKISMEKQLKSAFDAKEFELYYQPQIDIHSWQIVGAEALLRWNHPERGTLLPDTFIPIAEETGLMIPIGTWILYTACAQNKTWQDAGVDPIRVTVNLSGVQFRQANFIETVDTILKETGLNPAYLEFEITESILMENMEEVIAGLNTLKSMGIHISIDDFGTGYSSLSYLNRFPIDTLKIDQSFVKDIRTINDDLAIIKAIIALAGSLNLKVIAEGVETEEQLAFLHKQGSDMIQGFLFSPPLPAGRFAGFLNEAKEPDNISVSMQKLNNVVVDLKKSIC